MNHPRNPIDVLYWDRNTEWDEFDCMQEALTAEWLIEQGFMPDPSEVLETRWCSWFSSGGSQWSYCNSQGDTYADVLTVIEVRDKSGDKTK